MQWVQDLSQSNVDNLNNVRCEATRYFRNKKKEYLKAKVKELETNRLVRTVSIRTCVGASVTLRRVTSLQLIK
jgi:hypothetical protein